MMIVNGTKSVSATMFKESKGKLYITDRFRNVDIGYQHE